MAIFSVRILITYKESPYVIIKSLMKQAKKALDHANKIKLRKHLNADALFGTLRKGFDKIDDHRKGTTVISLTDTLMSGFAVFSLKDPFLLAFGVFAYLMKDGARGLKIS